MNKMKSLLLLSLLCLSSPGLAQERKVIVPANAAQPVGPYSPGIMIGDYLYVSGQGVRTANNVMPEGIAAQARQCLENVKAVVTAAGLTLEHVVHMQLYLENLSDLPAVERVYAEYFPQAPPARVVLGVAKMPTGTPVEMTAVAVRNLSAKKPLLLPGLPPLGHASSAVAVGNRIYLSGIYGETALDVLSQLAQVLREARANIDGLLWRNEYSTTGRVGVQVRELPSQASLALSVVALKQPAKPGGSCRADGKTVFCLTQTGGGITDVQAQVKSVMQRLQGELALHGATLAHVTASNVYLDDINEFRSMNEAYASFFTTAPPTRTTVQPMTPVDRSKGDPALVRIAVVAVKD